MKNTRSTRRTVPRQRGLAVALSGIITATVALGGAWLPGASAQDVLAIQAGTIVPVTSAEIREGTIVIEGGRITAVGKDVEIPFNATVLRFPEGVVVPGLIHCNSAAGLRTPNENVPVVPFISVLDGVDPSSDDFPNARRNGITTTHVVPGNATRIGGQGAVLRPVGDVVDDMVLKSPSVLKLTVSPESRGYRDTYREGRMAHMAALRRDFLGLYRYLETLVEKEDVETLPETGTGASSLTSLLAAKPDWAALDIASIDEEKIDRNRLPLVRLVQRKIPAFIYCERSSDVLKAFEIIDTHGIRATLVLGRDAHRAKDLLKSREDLGLVILDENLEDVEVDPRNDEERRIPTARILHDAGIRFAVQSSGFGGPFTTYGTSHLWYQGAVLVRQGVPRDEAMRALTIHPAKILGLDHRLGSIEEGKDANLTVFTGDVFDIRSWVDRVFIEGREVYNREEDRDLAELLRKKEKDF